MVFVCLICVLYLCVIARHLNNMQIVVLGVVRLEMAIDFGSKEVEPMLDEGALGTIKTVRVDDWTEIVHMCCLHNIA